MHLSRWIIHSLISNEVLCMVEFWVWILFTSSMAPKNVNFYYPFEFIWRRLFQFRQISALETSFESILPKISIQLVHNWVTKMQSHKCIILKPILTYSNYTQYIPFIMNFLSKISILKKLYLSGIWDAFWDSELIIGSFSVERE